MKKGTNYSKGDKMSDLVLREYQKENVEFFKKHGHMYLNDDTGLGKTITMFQAHREAGLKHGIYFTPKSLLDDVAAKNSEWFKDNVMIYTGKKKDRKKIWEAYIAYPEGCDYIIANYAMMKEIVALCEEANFWPWDTVMFDEIHLGQAGLMNYKNKRYEYAKKLVKNIPHVMLATATPMRNDLGDYYAPLSLLDPKKFRGYYPFIYKWGIVSNGVFGLDIARRPSNVRKFRAMLDEYRILHTYDAVAKQLPDVTHDIVPIRMSRKQAKYYEQLEEYMWIMIDDEFITQAPNELAKIVRQRQLLGSPKQFQINDNGTAVDYIVEELQSLPESATIAIFTPFRNTVTELEKILKKDYKVFVGMGGDDLQDKSKKFNQSKHKKKIWIGTIKSAIGYDLIGLSNMYFVGLDNSPINNKQAAGRCSGLRLTRPLLIKYLLYKDTVHNDILTRVIDKKHAIDWVNLPKNLYLKRIKNN